MILATRSSHHFVRSRIVAIALIAANVLIMAGSMRQGSGLADAGANDWPSLTVVYQSDGIIARLDYHDAYLWRKEILENRRDPTSVGTVMSFDRTVFRIHQDRAHDWRDTLADGTAVPERWLHPGFQSALEYRHFVVAEESLPGTLTYRQTIPAAACPLQEAGHPPIPQPAACEHGDTYREVETWTFRTDITPPMAIIGRSEADGQVQWQVEVLSVERVP